MVYVCWDVNNNNIGRLYDIILYYYLHLVTHSHAQNEESLAGEWQIGTLWSSYHWLIQGGLP